MLYIKVWNLQRTIKSCIKIPSHENNLIKKVILEASIQLNITGEKLVLANDGTELIEDEALLAFASEVIILLKKNEEWLSSVHQIIIKVWNLQRSIKSCVKVLNNENNIVKKVILEASRKLKITGEKLVLANDGTEIDEDEILLAFSSEILILLKKDENWLNSVEKTFIKVWNLDRSIKSFIKITNEDTNLLRKVTLEASKKLKITGDKLVLLNDGTEITEDEVLLAFSSQVLILLEKNEHWVAPVHQITTNLTDFANESIINKIELASELESLPSDSSRNSTYSPVNKSSDLFRGTEYSWIQFEIPWEILTSHMINECEAGKRSKLTITTIVHAVVNKMRIIKMNIPSKVFKIVAKKMIDKYPQMFIDTDDDNVILGDGSASLFSKLQDRNNYLNRQRKTKNTMDNVVHNKKRKTNTTAGCSNWDLEFDFGDNNEENFDFNKKTDDPDFFKTLEKLYANQRQLINRDPPISELKLKLPVLFKKDGIFWHFKQLTECDIQQLPTILDDKEQLIIKFLQKKKIISERVEDNNNNSKYLFLFKSISKYFKEKFEEFCYKVEDNLLIFQPDSILPVMVEFQDEFYIYIDDSLLYKEGLTFMNAFQILFALYFNFNMEYPTEITTTLEFIQRYFLKIHPDLESRSKVISATTKKCILFMAQLNNFSQKLLCEYSIDIYQKNIQALSH